MDWGDGNSSTGNVATSGKISVNPHVYTQAGNYLAELAVTDAKGAADTLEYGSDQSQVNLKRLAALGDIKWSIFRKKCRAQKIASTYSKIIE